MIIIDTIAAQRFWRKVKKQSPNECWLWIGAIGQTGYGNFGVNHRTVNAHRVAWILSHGDIPFGLQVLHHCDNRACVNPNHLFLGTQKVNVQDCVAKLRLRPAAGERHPRAVMSASTVALVRKSKARRAELAKQFGVSLQCIDKIINRHTWKHVLP